MNAAATMPDCLSVPAEELGKAAPVKVQIVGDAQDVAEHFAAALFDEMVRKPDATLIVPVAPVDQFPILARRINDTQLDCRQVLLINMDEYVADGDQ